MKTKIERQNLEHAAAWVQIYFSVEIDTYTDTNCLPDTPYNYRAFDVDEDGTSSEASNVVIGTTGPVTLALAQATLETLVFTWPKVTTATRYVLELAEEPPDENTQWTVVYDGPGVTFDEANFMATIEDLNPGTQYYARMKMYNGTSDTSGHTQHIAAKTRSPIPGAPVVSFVSSTASSITLNIASTSSVI